MGAGNVHDHGVDEFRDVVARLVQGHGLAGHGDHRAHPDRGHLVRVVGAVQKG